VVIGGLLLGAGAGVWFGGRRVVFAARQAIRNIIREELEARDGRSQHWARARLGRGPL